MEVLAAIGSHLVDEEKLENEQQEDICTGYVRATAGALNSLPRPVSDFRVTAFFWNSYKKIEEFCRPGIRVATFTLEIPLLHWREFELLKRIWVSHFPKPDSRGKKQV